MYITEYGRLAFKKINKEYKSLTTIDLYKKMLTHIDLSDIEYLCAGSTRTAGLGPALNRIICGLDYKLNNIESRSISNACATGLETLIDPIEKNKNNSLSICAESMSNAVDYKINGKIQNSNYIDGFICPQTKLSMLDWAMYYNTNNSKYTTKQYTKTELDMYAFNQLQKYKLAHNNSNYTDTVFGLDYIKPFILEDFFNKSDLNHSGLGPSNTCFLADGAAYIKSSRYKNNALVKIKDYMYCYVQPKYTIFAGIDMLQQILKKYNISDIDFFEIHDAFPNTIKVLIDTYDLNVDILNIYGSSVSIGHPISVTGMRIVQHAITALKEFDKELACVIIPSSGGLCVSLILENI